MRCLIPLLSTAALSACVSPGVASIPNKAISDSYIDLIALPYRPYLKKLELTDGQTIGQSQFLSNESNCQAYVKTFQRPPQAAVAHDTSDGGATSAISDSSKSQASDPVNPPNADSWCAAAVELLPHRQVLKACDAETNPANKETCKYSARNQLIGELLLVVDRYYNDYEGNIAASSANRNFWFENGSSLAAGLSAVLDPIGAKTALAALASALTQVNTSVTKNFYAEMTLTVLTIRMRQDRETVLVAIRKRLLDPYSVYPMESALLDVDRLYRAGTLNAAIQGVATPNGTLPLIQTSPALAREQRVISELASQVMKDGWSLIDADAQKLGPGSTIEAQILTFVASDNNEIATANGLISELSRRQVKVKNSGTDKKDTELSSLLLDRLAAAYASTASASKP